VNPTLTIIANALRVAITSPAASEPAATRSPAPSPRSPRPPRPPHEK
jgi:hypothetical protein